MENDDLYFHSMQAAILILSSALFLALQAPVVLGQEQPVLDPPSAAPLDVEQEVDFAEEEELDTRYTGEGEEHEEVASLAVIPEHERKAWLLVLPLAGMLLLAWHVRWRGRSTSRTGGNDGD